MLVTKARLRFVVGANSPVDVIGAPGRVTTVDLEALHAASWLAVRRSGNRVEVRRGPRLPK